MAQVGATSCKLSGRVQLHAGASHPAWRYTAVRGQAHNPNQLAFGLRRTTDNARAQGHRLRSSGFVLWHLCVLLQKSTELTLAA